MNSEQEQLHFIGVGGVGMSGIARVAHDQGMAVSGSDIKESRYTKQLRDAGVTVFIGQDGANIPDGDVTVVVSTAILENNPELIEARRRNLPIVHRAQMLARLGRDLDTLAVAGTHGKTTTSSMLASTLDAMGYDPTFLIGGIVRAYGTNAHSGRGRSYVVEADESDKSFTYLSPAAAIVTNIEADHLDHYEGLDEIYAQFAAFLSGVREDGPIVVCGDDPKLAEVARGTGRAVTTYGFSEDCDARILATEAQGVGTRFTLRLPDGRVVASRIKQNPGLHNVSNGAAVLTLISLLGLDVDLAAEKLQEFAGVRRRFDLIGEAGGSDRGGRLRPSSHGDRRHHQGGQGPGFQPCARAVPAASLFPRCPVHRHYARRVRQRLRRGGHRHLHGRVLRRRGTGAGRYRQDLLERRHRSRPSPCRFRAPAHRRGAPYAGNG